ncbi:MAG TPA: tyrosine-type recombinase/integrase [Bryobacteraceae bacterium]|nr:tyrosine-type recombinase/integrase [Bryobacteraceae bacterium]
MRQRGSILRPRGARQTYSVKYRTTTGKQVFKGGFPTKAKAQEHLNEVLSQIDKGIYIERKPITFENFAGKWLDGRRRIRGATESAYGSMIRRQLVPSLGAYRIGDLQLGHIQQLVSVIIEDDELSVKYLHNTVTLLRTMLVGRKGASAMRLGYIDHDPTLGLELPPLATREIVPPTQEGVWKLINSARAIGGVGYPMTFLGAFTGWRRNEALASKFTDIDWFNHELRIRSAISKERSTDGAHKWEWVVGPPKTKKSVRRVALADSALKMLADFKALASTDGFIFEEQGGGFIDPDKFNAEIWTPIAEGAGLTGTRYHDLRHFFASQLIAQGESPAHVRDQLGHSSIKVTFDTYGHLFPGAGREAASRFDDSMKKARARSDAAGSNLVAATPEGEGADDPKRSEKALSTN